MAEWSKNAAGQITLCPLVGYVVNTISEMALCIRLEYIQSKEQLDGTPDAVQLVMTPELQLRDTLSDVGSIQSFSQATPLVCTTYTKLYNDVGRITKLIIETDGDPCDDEHSYQNHGQGTDSTLTGTRTHGNVVDVYQAGILMQRTIIYDPPKPP
jgi:hypothetical protein